MSRKTTKHNLSHETTRAAREVERAMTAASRALTEQMDQIIALRRILISERAQLIFYTEFSQKHCIILVPNWMDLDAEIQEVYVKRAAIELAIGEEIGPHDSQRVVKPQ